MCILLQKNHHAGRGYGYVAVSRFKSRAGVHLYGKLRRTDFLPVGEEKEDEVLERGWDSTNTSDDEEKGMAKGMAARYADESSDEEGYLAGASDDDDDDQKERQEYLASLGDDDACEGAYLDRGNIVGFGLPPLSLKSVISGADHLLVPSPNLQA